MTLTPTFLDELRARVAVSTVVARRVKLTRAGREMKGCCPFHNEKSPSFFVNDDKGFYHCFGCGAHGDVIRFVVEQEGLGFIDAVKSLAAEAGLEMPEETPEARQRAQAAEGLHDVTGTAAAWFSSQLREAGGATARDYLAKRGIAEKTVTDFGLGYSPDSRSRLRTALTSVGDAKLIETGLLIQPEAEGNAKPGDPYDRFRGRLMFPIRDPRGRVIGFGGRILGDGQPKYLNSPDTPLFDKGRTLYNLDRAGPIARKSLRLIVVEGYMDVIGLAQAGFADAVAPLGTALTETQLGMMWRIVPEPVLCFDGDAAGQRAGLRAAMRALPLLEPGKSLRFVTLPSGKDPDDIVREEGAEAFDRLLAGAIPLHEIIWDATVSMGDVETPEQKAGLEARLRDLVKSIGNDDVRAAYDIAFRDRFWRTFGRGATRSAPVLTLVSSHAAELRDLKLLDSEMVAVLVGVMNYPKIAAEMFEQLVRIPYSRNIVKNLAQRIIEALTWAPELERIGLANWLKNEGFGSTARTIRDANKLSLSFTMTRRRLSRAPEDLRTFISAIDRYHVLHSEWEQACIKAKASHRDGCSKLVMTEMEASKEVYRQQLEQHYQELYEYVQRLPPDEFDPKEPDWDWPAQEEISKPASEVAAYEDHELPQRIYA